MKNEENINKYLEFKQMTNRSRKGVISRGTLKLYRVNLQYLEKALGNKSFKDATENDILETIKNKSPATKNNRLIVYRDFYRWLFNLDRQEPLPQFLKRLNLVRISKDDIEYRQKIISEAEYNKLLDFAFNPMYKAIIETLWITGGRKGAVQSIKSDGVSYDGKYTRIILWTSKTETREVIYPDRAEHLLLWAESLQPFRGEKGKPLFATKKNGADGENYKQINDQFAYNFLQRIAKNAGIRSIRPHDFRHTKISAMLKDGVPETHVKTLLGFTKNTDMLRIYDHNRLKDYEEWMMDHETDSKPTYQLLEKQKKTLEEKHDKEINKLQETMEKLQRDLLEVKLKQVQQLQREKI